MSDHELAAKLATDAGRLLLTVRKELSQATEAERKAAGDKRSHDYLMAALAAERPHDAVLSEEGADDPVRLQAERVWIVDPLDGTREFTTRGRDDWAVHVALWQRDSGDAGAITDAAVSLPAYNNRSNVVFRSDTVTAPTVPDDDGRPIRVAVSASRMPAVVRLIREVVDVEPVLMGSAGAKAMAVVRGDVDAYLHAGGQWEWDSAAPGGVVRAAGMHATRLDGSPLRYNRPDPYLPDLLMCRPEVAPTLLDAVRRTLF